MKTTVSRNWISVFFFSLSGEWKWKRYVNRFQARCVWSMKHIFIIKNNFDQILVMTGARNTFIDFIYFYPSMNTTNWVMMRLGIDPIHCTRYTVHCIKRFTSLCLFNRCFFFLFEVQFPNHLWKPSETKKNMGKMESIHFLCNFDKIHQINFTRISESIRK